MRFVGIHRSDALLPAGTDGDLIVAPCKRGGWELWNWEPGMFVFGSVKGHWEYIERYDDLTDALAAAVFAYDVGPRVLLVDGEERVSFKDFFTGATDLAADEVASIVQLSPGQTYRGGGGAAAEWTVQAIAEVV